MRHVHILCVCTTYDAHVFFIVWGCVCYCVVVVFVIVSGLCLLLCGGCVHYYVGLVFVIVCGLCLLLCGGCVCYCQFCLVAQI